MATGVEHFVRLTRSGHTFDTNPQPGPPSEAMIQRIGSIDIVKGLYGHGINRAELIVRTYEDTVAAACDG